jgi:hypothetical protein
MNKNTVITTEQCEACSTLREFSINDLIDQDLVVTFTTNHFGTVEVSYEGYWSCRCDHDNSTLGKAEAL